MVRYSEHDTSKIYQAADSFRANCLLPDGSLLFGDASVWRPDVLDRIHKAFVATPDEGDLTFIDKFKDQVGKAGHDVSRLAAKILSVYFLFPSSVGPVRKRQVVNEALSWGGDTLPESHPVSAAFANRIGSGGQGYNTRRPFEIAFLIELAIAWKKLPKDRQVGAATQGINSVSLYSPNSSNPRPQGQGVTIQFRLRTRVRLRVPPPIPKIPTLIGWDFFCPFPQCWRGFRAWPRKRSRGHFLCWRGFKSLAGTRR